MCEPIRKSCGHLNQACAFKDVPKNGGAEGVGVAGLGPHMGLLQLADHPLQRGSGQNISLQRTFKGEKSSHFDLQSSCGGTYCPQQARGKGGRGRGAVRQETIHPHTSSVSLRLGLLTEEMTRRCTRIMHLRLHGSCRPKSPSCRKTLSLKRLRGTRLRSKSGT